MALKKSELYSSLWASCDELRGGMDASQYKDYVLVLLFVKYISDRFAGQPYAAITIPRGASFAEMVALKGRPDIGDQINKKIIAPLANANKLSDLPDFNDTSKLAPVRKWWTGSPTSSLFSRTRRSISRRIGPKATIF
jgi:type I restriction enzyme M protein